MALNFESAQLVMGAAIVDPRFARLLLRNRGRALREVEQLPCAPDGARLSDEDRLLLGSIRATSLQQFARGVERLCGEVRALPERRPAARAGGLALAAAPAADFSPRGERASRASLALLAPLAPLGAR